MTPTLPPPAAAPTSKFQRIGGSRGVGPIMGLPASRQEQERLTLFQYIAALYLFLYFSRMIEFIPTVFRPMLVFTVILVGGALMSGRFLAMFSLIPGKLLGGFFLWNCVCFVFSIWPGGSLEWVISSAKFVISTMIVVAFATSLRSAMMLLLASGFGLGTASLFPSFSGGEVAGRLVTSTGGGEGTLGDPNYFCLFLLSGLPLLWLAAKHGQGIRKAFPLLLSVWAMMVAVKTGSRGGMIAIVIGIGFYMLQATQQQRLRIFAGSIVAIFGVLLFAPQHVLLRLGTMVEIDTGRTQTEEERKEAERAAGSAHTRLDLLQRGIEFTFKNPIFGLGPGMFPVANNDRAQAEGGWVSWHETHNMYVQASSETGFIGFGLFLAVFISSYRALGRIRQWCRTNAHPKGLLMYDAALYLQIAFVIFMVDGFFLSIVYMSNWWLMAGLAMGLSVGCHHEITTRPVQRVGATAVRQSTVANDHV